MSNNGVKISALPPYAGPPISSGDIPISIGGVTYKCSPSQFNVGAQVRQPIFATAGVTAGFAVGDYKIVNPSFAGWNPILEIRGVGALEPIVEFTFDNVDTITLTDTAYLTQPNEIWIIRFQ